MTDVTLSWSAPTANTDGTKPVNLGGYNLYVASTAVDLAAFPNTRRGGTPLSVGNVLTYTLKNVLPGTYYYAVTAWYCRTNTDCTESAKSEYASVTVGPSIVTTTTPAAPGSLKVTVTVSAP